MKQCNVLTGEKLSQAYAKACEKKSKSRENTRALKVLEKLSQTIDDMREAGVNARLHVRAGDHSDADDMIYTVMDNTARDYAFPLYGYIQIGMESRLFAICTSYANASCASLFLSAYTAREEWSGNDTSRKAIYGEHYDFDEDSGALRQLQKDLIDIAAQQTIIPTSANSSILPMPGKANITGKTLKKAQLG